VVDAVILIPVYAHLHKNLNRLFFGFIAFQSEFLKGIKRAG